MKRGFWGGRKVALDSSCLIVTHGNSITYGTGSSDAATRSWPGLLAASPLFGGAGVSINKQGVHGQGWGTMLGTEGVPNGIDNLYDPARTCILITQEGTNAMRELGQMTARQAADACWTYWRNRFLLHPEWLGVVWTVLPTFTSDGVVSAAAVNLRINEYNDIMRHEWKQNGLSACIEMRGPGSVWDYSGTVEQDYRDRQAYWAESSFFTHPSDAGYRRMADTMAAGLLNLRQKRRP